MNRIAKLFRDSFSIDLKMLGLFRFLLGMIILWDLWGRFQIRRLVFGSAESEGIVPAELSASGHSIWHFSLFWTDRLFSGIHQPLGQWLGEENGLVRLLVSAETYCQSPAWVDLIFYLGLAAAILYCLGLFSRFAAAFLWVVLLSVQHCMPMMNTGGDSLLKMFAFWSIFLPIGCQFSLDSLLFSRNGYWRKRVGQLQMRVQTWCSERGLESPRFAQNICTVATTAMMLQLVSIYFFSGLEKCNPVWFSGEALGKALSCPNYVKPLGDTLSGQTWMTTPMTWIVMIVELLLPVLVFTPFLFRYTRRPTILFLWMMHLGIALTMSIGTFSLIASTAWLLFLPSRLGAYSSTNWLLRLLGVPGKPNQQILEADKQFLESQSQDPVKRRFMADAVVVEYETEEDVASDLAKGSFFLDPAAGKWSTAADYFSAAVIISIIWWQFSFVPKSIVGEVVHGSFPKPIAPAVYCLSIHDRFPMFGHPPEGEVTLHCDLTKLPKDDLGPRIPFRPPGLFEPHPQFLWRQFHFNLSYRSTYTPEFIQALKDQFQNWMKSNSIEPSVSLLSKNAPSQLVNQK